MDIDLSFIVDFFNTAIKFFEDGLYNFLHDGFIFLVAKATIAFVEMKIYLLEIAWQAARLILENYAISERLNSALSSIGDISVISALRIPEALNLIFSAHLTKFIIKQIL